jgi:hypothetical protein
MRCGALVLALFAGLAAAACVTPDEDHRHSPIASASRVLAIDFSPSAANRRTRSVSQLPSAARSELARAGDIAPLVAEGTSHELARTASIAPRATGIVADELTRHPAMPTWLLPTSAEFSVQVANDLVTAAEVVFGRHRAMGEIDDRRHRVDPHDDHPEAGLWERFRHRLWL